jgi:hypothetical protein
MQIGKFQFRLAFQLLDKMTSQYNRLMKALKPARRGSPTGKLSSWR